LVSEIGVQDVNVRVRTISGKFEKVMEILNAIFQDLEGFERFFKWLWKSFGICLGKFYNLLSWI